MIVGFVKTAIGEVCRLRGIRSDIFFVPYFGDGFVQSATTREILARISGLYGSNMYGLRIIHFISWDPRIHPLPEISDADYPRILLAKVLADADHPGIQTLRMRIIRGCKILHPLTSC